MGRRVGAFTEDRVGLGLGEEEEGEEEEGWIRDWREFGGIGRKEGVEAMADMQIICDVYCNCDWSCEC